MTIIQITLNNTDHIKSTRTEKEANFALVCEVTLTATSTRNQGKFQFPTKAQPHAGILASASLGNHSLQVEQGQALQQAQLHSLGGVTPQRSGNKPTNLRNAQQCQR